MNVKQVIASEVAGRADVDLVDVRTPAEFRAGHAKGARNVPLDSIDPTQLWKQRPADKQMVLICKSGKRASTACEKLTAAGYTEAVVVEGGTDAWQAAGLPVEASAGRKTISLERQVRIVAGALVVVGVGLGLAVHPGFFGLAGFVGCGLMVAGATDFCGMAMLLGRAPWNR